MLFRNKSVLIICGSYIVKNKQKNTIELTNTKSRKSPGLGYHKHLATVLLWNKEMYNPSLCMFIFRDVLFST